MNPNLSKYLLAPALLCVVALPVQPRAVRAYETSPGCAAFAAELRGSTGLDFRTRSTGRFDFAYRCTEAEMDSLQEYAAAFYAQVYPRFFDGEPSRAFRLVYFRDHVEYRAHSLYPDNYGYYSYATRALYTWAHSGHGTLWHELIHAFMDANIREDPHSWFNEGLASFFEMAFLVNGAVVEGYTNWRHPLVLAALAAGTIPPLRDFLRARKIEVPAVKAYARFLFCYLWTKGVMDGFARAYLHRLLPAASGEELDRRVIALLEELLGKGIEGIDADVRAAALSVGPDRKLTVTGTPRSADR